MSEQKETVEARPTKERYGYKWTCPACNVVNYYADPHCQIGYVTCWTDGCEKRFKVKVIEAKKVIKLKLKKNDWDEWEVQYLEDGVKNEAKTYYTDDKDDAKATMKAIQKKIDDGCEGYN